MSQYGLEYRLEWDTMPAQDTTGEVIASQTVRVSIFDTDNIIGDTDTPEVINLQPSGNPLVISTINNDRDKLQPIRSKQAVVEFLSDSPAFEDASTFADASDNRWFVKITADTTDIIFYGYVMLADMQQPFQPDPTKVVLTCSDHLGVLKDIPFTTDAGENPTGKYRLAEIIAICLKKTGLTLPIRAINNLRHGAGELTVNCTFNNPHTINGFTDTSFFYVGQRIIITNSGLNDGTTNVTAVTSTSIDVSAVLTTDFAPGTTFTDYSSSLHFYDGTYVDALTFESTIGECEDCYTVLEKILGEDCFIGQWLGRWFIMRVDEYDGNPIFPADFDSDGVFTSFVASTNFNKSIGNDQPTKLALADAIKQFDRPNLFIKETFRFNLPSETPCNSDYSRGDASADPDIQLTGYSAYDLDCWEVFKLWGSARVAGDFKSSIQRSFNALSDETGRFIMLTYPTSFTPNEYILSSAIPIGYQDKMTLNFDAAAVDDPAGDGVIFICMILLYGSDGTVWNLLPFDMSQLWLQTLGEIQTQWKQTDAEVSLFRDAMRWGIFDDADHPNKTEWTSFIASAAPTPIDGEIRLHFFAANQFTASYDTFRIKYQNIRVDIRSNIGGSYGKYVGQYQKVTRDPPDGYFAKRDKEVFISDSPKPAFKGSMFWYNGSTYSLVSRFYTAAPFYTADPPASVGAPPDSTYLHRYGYIQAFSVMNQFRNNNRIFQGSVLGLGSSWTDLFNKVILSDTNPNTDNRFFMLISFEQDWKTGLWKATFIEITRTDIGKVYSDPQEFKYITENG